MMQEIHGIQNRFDGRMEANERTAWARSRSKILEGLNDVHFRRVRMGDLYCAWTVVKLKFMFLGAVKDQTGKPCVATVRTSTKEATKQEIK